MELLLTYLGKSAGLLIVFFALYYFLLRQDHSFSTNRKFLLGGLFASAILPSVQFTRTVFIEAQNSTFQIFEGDFPVSEVVPQEPVITPMQILLAIYLTGVAFMTGRMLLQLISLSKVLYSGQISKYGGINYIAVTGKMAPFSFLNFIVYNPALHSETELQHILKHEKAHVIQWHTADVLLANLNLIYQWFNPFAWLYVKILQQNLEYIADSEAVKEVPCKKEYQKVLVKISTKNFNPALTNSFYQSFIKKRIVMLNKNTTSKNNYWKVSLALPFMLAFILLFNVKTEAQIITTENPVEETEMDTTQTVRVSAIISKESSEERLAFLKQVFEKQDVILTFENIERSPEGFITAITVNFLDKNTNNSGVTNQNNPEGISSFEVFVDNGSIGFANVSKKNEKGIKAKDVVTKAGENALYIVNNKEYTGRELAGKAIEINGGFTFLGPENSVKYGDKGKDGVFMISRGKIIDDIDEEMKRIDFEDAPVKKSYIRIRKGEKPMFMEVDKTSGSNSNGTASEHRKFPSDTVKNLMTEKEIKGIYIVNGIEVSGSIVKGINPENIKSINVLKGAAAVSVYGKKAEDIAIIIETKNDNFNGRKDSSINSENGKSTRMVIKNDSLGKDDFTVLVSGIPNSKNGTQTINIDSTDINASQWGTRSSPGTMVYLGNNEPLYILDGKVTPKNFDIKSIDHEKIVSITVLKGKDATSIYGKAAKEGAVLISTKESDKRVVSIATTFSTDDDEGNLISYNEMLNSHKKEMIIINGTIQNENFDLRDLDPNQIQEMSVSRGDKLIGTYGNRAKDGVIKITTKTKNKLKESPASFAVLKANTTEEGLRSMKSQLKEQAGLDVNFSSIKRNREGLITAIKITGKKGKQEVSGTYNETGQIPDVYIGVQKDKIVVSSTPPNKK